MTWFDMFQNYRIIDDNVKGSKFGEHKPRISGQKNETHDSIIIYYQNA